MELTEAISLRRSIRKFKPDPVPDNFITELLEAARLAPSGTNIQPWRFVVIKSEQVKAKLADCTPLPYVSNAPVVLACCVDTHSMSSVGHRVNELLAAGAFTGTPLAGLNADEYVKGRIMDEATAKAYLRLNAAIAIEHITLRAVDLGLGTCWVMMFDPKKVKTALELEDRYNVVALIPVGYPDQQPSPRPRIALSELILKEL